MKENNVKSSEMQEYTALYSIFLHEMFLTAIREKMLPEVALYK